MIATDEKLQLRFDPRTIEHLGIKMYSRLPYALAELVANSYDAGADYVNIRLYDNESGPQRIVVEDNGEGMSFSEVNDNFLVIGRRRRDADCSRKNSKGRIITGKKGVGKLALFGIGQTIRIETSKIGEEKKTVLVLDWEEIINETSGSYFPKTEIIDKEPEESGTVIELFNLSRSSRFDVEATAVSLAKLFNWFDDSFEVSITLNDKKTIKLTRDLIYSGINVEFEWHIADVSDHIKSDFSHKDEIKGVILSSLKPIKPDLRGITLYINGRLANVPSFFGLSEAGHPFSYLSGWIEADYLDDLDKDIISTDRQSLSWDMPEAEQLQDYLQKIVRYIVNDWSEKRKNKKKNDITLRSGVKISEWYETVPPGIIPKLSKVIDSVSKKPEIDDEDFSQIVKDIHELVPPYTYYHYRFLHPQIQAVTKEYYVKKDYYLAFQEAMKRYKNAVKDKSSVSETEDMQIVSQAFGSKNGRLKTTAKFKNRPNGQPFSDSTLSNIEDGQQTLSRGVVQGGRNVVSHEEYKDLCETGLFTEKDCLDLLSLLSHLFKRLDESEKQE